MINVSFELNTGLTAKELITKVEILSDHYVELIII